MKWQQATNVTPEYETRLAAILASWNGTPYMAGQQCRGVGVDCVRFVCAVLDELYRQEPVPIETLPSDAALHARESAIGAMKKIRDCYMPNDAIEDGTMEPGDILVTGPANGGPGHAMIVGTRPNQLWHAAGDGVHVTALHASVHVFRVYRMRDRSKAC